MKKKGILVNAKIGSTVAKRVIFGSEHIVIEGAGSIIGDSVMNGIYYPLDEVSKLASDTTGIIHAPASHPTDANGNFIAAGSPEGIHQGYIGAISYNYRMNGGRLVRDIAIDPEKASASPMGREVLSRIENEQDTDTSTGLLMYIDEVEGVGKDGERYSYVARNMMLDHDAILVEERGAATTGQGVGMFANSEGVNEELEFSEFLVNMCMPAMNMNVAPASHAFDEDTMIENIKKYTDSEKAPSFNYRRFFLNFDRSNADSFEAYIMPYADIINGEPMVVLSALNAYKERLGVVDDSMKSKDKEMANKVIDHYLKKDISNSFNEECGDDCGIIKRMANVFFDFVANHGSNSYNTDVSKTNQGKEDIMRTKILAALSAAGVETEGLDDAALLEAYDKLSAPKKESNLDADAISNAIADAVAKATESLTDRIEKFETAANANKEAEFDALVADVVELDIGIDEEAASAMNAEKLTAIINKNKCSLAFNVSNSVAKRTGAKSTLPAFDE